MPLDGRAGILEQQVGRQLLTGLQLRIGHLGIVGFVGALEADAYGKLVGPLGVCSHPVDRTAPPDRTVLAYQKVIPAADPAVGQVPAVDILDGAGYRVGMVQDDSRGFLAGVGRAVKYQVCV